MNASCLKITMLSSSVNESTLFLIALLTNGRFSSESFDAKIYFCTQGIHL